MRKQNSAIANYAAPFLPLRKGEWPKAEGVLGYLSTSNRTLAIQGSIAGAGASSLLIVTHSLCESHAPTRDPLAAPFKSLPPRCRSGQAG